MPAGDRISEFAADVGLVDHHVHGALRQSVPRSDFDAMLTEAPRGPSVATVYDSQIGFAIRRWCAPLLDLAQHATAESYLARRQELGEAEVNRRLLRATGVETYVVETGYLGDAVLSPAEMAEVTGAAAVEVVRLETVAESLLHECGSAEAFAARYVDALADATATAVGTKSVMAYRSGFDVAAERPSTRQVVEAVGETLAGTSSGERPRITHPVLLRHLQWCGIDRGLPVQIHCGYGDPDLDLHRANPILLTRWLRLTEPSGVPVMLLHNYPYHREAGYLAQVFDHVYFDVGLGVNYSGAASRAVIAESFELGPFHKQMFSSDAWGPGELHYLGALQWRRGVASVIGGWVEQGEWDLADAERVIRLVARDNAIRAYGLG